MLQQPVPVILCIDVEPDKPFAHRSNPMPLDGYQRAVEFFAGFRRELEALTLRPVHLSWYYRMDPQIKELYGDPGWAIVHYPDEVEKLLSANDELGLHTHPIRWDQSADNWIQDYGNQRCIEHSLRMAFETFRSGLGRSCVSFRFGDRWMNNRTFQLLEKLGIKYDLTLEPGSKKMPSYHGAIPHTGYIPDQRKVTRKIYRPARSNYQKMDPSRTDGPYVIPVSTAPIHLGTGAIYRAPAVYRRLYYRLVDPERIRNWTHALNIALETPLFRSVVDYNLRVLKAPYLTMVARTHIFNSTEFTDNVRANLRSLFEDSDRHDKCSFAFMTPAEAVACLAVV